jgi:hypothetical protein
MARSKAQPDRRGDSLELCEASLASRLAVLVGEGCGFGLAGTAKHSLRSLIDNKHDELGSIVLNVQA